MAIALNPADAPSWYEFVTNFDATYQAFYDNYNGLINIGPYIQNTHPEELPGYMDLLQRGSIVANKLEQLKATRDYVYSWLQWLQSGASNISDFISSSAQSTYQAITSALGLGGLGIAPVFVVVGLTAAIAVLVTAAGWIKDAYIAAQRYNAYQDAEAKGATPTQAAAVVNSLYGPPGSTTGIFGIPFNFLIFAALAIFLGPPIIKAITDQRVGR